MAMESSSSSFSYRFTYDVFLSFRGEDTRYSFTGYLYKALCDRGIHTFIDDQKLPRGDQITSALEKAIQESRIFIIVLSENYAFSSFCLNELVYILNFIKGKGLLVLPIFYKVNPSDVRYHRGSFGEALSNHEKKFNTNKESFRCNMEKLEKWKMALNQVAYLSGFPFKHGDGYEFEFIQRIVELVSEKINRAPLNAADCPVGLESQVRKVKLLLDVGSDVVHIVGIHGLSDIGVESVKPDLKKSEVSMNGLFEAVKLVEHVYKTTGKHELTVTKEEAAKEANKGEKTAKEGEMNEKGSDEGEENKEKKEAEGEAKPEAATEETMVVAEECEKNEKGSGEGEENNEKKEAEGEAKSEEAATEETTVVAEEGEKNEKGSGEGEENNEKKEAESEAKPEGAATEEDMAVDVKQSEYYYNLPPKYGMESYVYPGHVYPPPQIFSDENPHACSVM